MIYDVTWPLSDLSRIAPAAACMPLYQPCHSTWARSSCYCAVLLTIARWVQFLISLTFLHILLSLQLSTIRKLLENSVIKYQRSEIFEFWQIVFCRRFHIVWRINTASCLLCFVSWAVWVRLLLIMIMHIGSADLGRRILATDLSINNDTKWWCSVPGWPVRLEAVIWKDIIRPVSDSILSYLRPNLENRRIEANTEYLRLRYSWLVSFSGVFEWVTYLKHTFKYWLTASTYV